MLRTEDEYGVRWLVQPGDPANAKILTLRRNYVSWVVLPREVLRGRGEAYSASSDVLRQTRLLDCLEVISG